MTIQVLAGANLEELALQSPLSVFDPQIMAFCQALSTSLLKHPQAKLIPELAALGFWLRKANLLKMKQDYPSPTYLLRKPLGVVVHYTPANVDTMFVYSWICALLMGNNNLVRLASREAPAKSALLSVLNQLFAQEQFQPIAVRNTFANYPRDAEEGTQVSLMADARIIWGGDESVQAIRRLPCKPRCRDIPFADRYSVALINGDAVSQNKVEKLAELLWRDIHPYSQMACSSPKVLFWLGERQWQSALWQQIAVLNKDTPPAIHQRMDHLVTGQLAQASELSHTHVTLGQLSVVCIDKWDSSLVSMHPGQGLLYLISIATLDDMLALLSDKCQTLSYWGLDANELLRFLSEPSITGIDRAVPIGQALDFSTVWDGFDMLQILSRQVLVG